MLIAELFVGIEVFTHYAGVTRLKTAFRWDDLLMQRMPEEGRFRNVMPQDTMIVAWTFVERQHTRSAVAKGAGHENGIDGVIGHCASTARVRDVTAMMGFYQVNQAEVLKGRGECPRDGTVIDIDAQPDLIAFV